MLAALPWIGNSVLVSSASTSCCWRRLAQGWNIIGGYAGYPSFGNSVFYGLGAYGVAIAMVQYDLPFWVGMLLGLGLGVAFAGLLGLAVLRLKGHYFAICTLGLALVMTAIVSNLEIAGGNIGLVLPLLRSEVLFYELALGLLVLATLTIFWLSRSRFGLGLIAIRENEEGAAVMGVNTTLYKVLAFMLSAAFTALAGGIYAYYITFIDPVGVFDIVLNVKMIIMAVLGGPGSVLGPVVGAFILSVISKSSRPRSRAPPACSSASSSSSRWCSCRAASPTSFSTSSGWAGATSSITSGRTACKWKIFSKRAASPSASTA